MIQGKKTGELIALWGFYLPMEETVCVFTNAFMFPTSPFLFVTIDSAQKQNKNGHIVA